MDAQAEKFSIKNMIFTKTVPNYVIPFSTKGYKVYGCTDCGDKFLLQSSYQYHINRKSLQITFTCRICNTRNIFYNRCTLLAHIRSHAFKTATININDIIIEPLPLTHFKIVDKNTPPLQTTLKDVAPIYYCHECKYKLSGPLVEHLMDHKKKQTIKCPLCAFTVPTMCALKYHLRLHLEKPPFICPECGITLHSKKLLKTNNHKCLGFKILRANGRFRCEIPSCAMVYPFDHQNEHMIKHHVKNVFKCPLCVVACFSGPMMESHLQNNHPDNPKNTPVFFYQCDLCPGRLVLENQLSNHLSGHEGKQVYPCRICGDIYLELLTLIKHYIDSHGQNQKDICAVLLSLLSKDKYSVVKKCEKCQRYFKYKCSYDDIDDLPTDCPYKCSSASTEIKDVANDTESNDSITEAGDIIKCYICKYSIVNNWADIKKHFYYNHRNIKCVDVKVNLNRINVSKKNKIIRKIEKSRTKNRNNKRKRNSKSGGDITVNTEITGHEKGANESSRSIICKKCEKSFDTKELFLEHIISHRDPYMAYQCMECGDCFVVKPSFSTHLLIEHSISDPEEYITKNQCYNKAALLKNDLNPVIESPLKENQCNICREQFSMSDDLEKHYRVHGMAFLKKNTSNQSNSSSP